MSLRRRWAVGGRRINRRGGRWTRTGPHCPHDRDSPQVFLADHTCEALSSEVTFNHPHAQRALGWQRQAAAGKEFKYLLTVLLVEVVPRLISMQDVSVVDACLIVAPEITISDAKRDTRWHDLLQMSWFMRSSPRNNCELLTILAIHSRFFLLPSKRVYFSQKKGRWIA